jgi:hypothetical protein
MHIRRVAYVFTLAAYTAAGLLAQSFQGGIRGTVNDSSGAAVDLSKVILTDEGTGIARSTVTSSGGEYTFTAINPATYTITVIKPGLKTVERKGVTVGTQEFLNVDLALTVGDVKQRVECCIGNRNARNNQRPHGAER